MKKTCILFFSLLCLAGSISLFAGKPVTVKSGDLSVLKKSSTAFFEIDFSATKVGTQPIDEYLKGRGDDFVRDWPQDKVIAANYFYAQFNGCNKKGMQITPDDRGVDYKMVIHVKTLDMGNPAGIFVPFAPANAGGVIIDGTVDIIDMNTNAVVCTLNIDGVKGDGYPSESIRLGLAFSELASCMCKLK